MTTTLDIPTTIRVRGRDYAVTTRVHKSTSAAHATVFGGEELIYVLTGPRGARYRTMRNVPRPHMMFLVNDKDFVKSSVVEGVWLSDKDGRLKVVEQ